MGAPEEWTVSAPHMTSVMLLLLHTPWYHEGGNAIRFVKVCGILECKQLCAVCFCSVVSDQRMTAWILLSRSISNLSVFVPRQVLDFYRHMSFILFNDLRWWVVARLLILADFLIFCILFRMKTKMMVKK